MLSFVAAGVTAAAAKKTNNFLVPNGTFIAEVIAFFVILFVLRKYVVPPVSKAMNARQELIRKQIDDSRAAQERLEQAEKSMQAAVAETRADAARIREEARAQGQAIIDEMRQRAQEEADRVSAREQGRLESERQQIVAQLRTEVGQIAVDLAGKLLGEQLSDEAAQRRTVDRFLADLDSSAAASSQPAGSSDAAAVSH